MEALQKSTIPVKKPRNSNIELLKILAILLIVCSHVVQTLSAPNVYAPVRDYVIDLGQATTDLPRLVLSILRYSGALGSTLFFVCSAWFLLESKKANVGKIVTMVLEIWVISVLILAVVWVARGGDLQRGLIVKSLFPTTFASNWYTTCYLLLYAMHPVLNAAIASLSQKGLLKAAVFLGVLYMGLNLFRPFFFTSELVSWVAMYFVLAYIRIYTPKTANNVRVNRIALIAALLGNLGLILMTNFLGLRVEFFRDKLLQWNKICSPFFFVAAVAALNLARQTCSVRRPINYISGLSLYIYLIHENLLFRSCYRPVLWSRVYHTFGFGHVLFWVFAMVALVFAFGFGASVLYTACLQRAVRAVAGRLTAALRKGYEKIEGILLRIT